MLTEMEIVEATASFLKGKGYSIEHCVSAVTERGDDIVARSQAGQRVVIEAKGQGSSQSYTKRFGREFSKSQKEGHLGRAMVRLMEPMSTGSKGVIALPQDTVTLGILRSRKKALEVAGFIVLTVEPSSRQVVTALGKLPE